MPSTNQKTIAAVSNPRERHTTKERAPLTQEQKAERREDSARKQADIDAAVQDWWTYTEEKATELAKRFDKKERYFLDIFFQGGARMVNHHKEVSPYNAFKSEKAAELREVGKALNAPELHREYYDEYAILDDTEKAALIQRFTENRDTTKIRRATPKARVQDVANTVRNMQMLMTALSNRVGIEGMFVIVRNNTDFNMPPQWHFTSKELERYMPLAVRKRWDTGEVGGKLEAFAIAGCDTINLLRTAPQKAAFAKGEIRDSIHKMLVEITGNSDAVMAYVHKEDVIFKYGVELVGWTPDKWCNPSELTTSLPVLRTLLNAIKDGTCKFVRIPPAELKARKAKYEQDLAAGLITGKQRKRRSDIGQKRKRAAADDGEEDESDNEHNDGTTADGAAVPANAATPTANAPTSTAAPYSVEEPQEPSALPARKRRKTANEAAPAKKVPAAKKVPVAKSTTTRPKPRAKGKAANKENRRDDTTTRAAIARLKVGNAPGSAGGRAFKSRAVIDDDEDDTPSADAPGNASIVADSDAAATAPAAVAAA